MVWFSHHFFSFSCALSFTSLLHIDQIQLFQFIKFPYPGVSYITDDDYYEDDEEDDPDALKDPIYQIDLQVH